ncbi:MAG TPA: hypothetical protein VF495_28265, partial [Phenylobacterium sp.]
AIGRFLSVEAAELETVQGGHHRDEDEDHVDAAHGNSAGLDGRALARAPGRATQFMTRQSTKIGIDRRPGVSFYCISTPGSQLLSVRGLFK